MGKKKARGNAEGDVYPRKDKDGKVVGYRGAYWVHTAEGPSAASSRARPRPRHGRPSGRLGGTPPTGSPSKRAL